jgi:outer membrane lipoprotein-sorting protein
MTRETQLKTFAVVAVMLCAVSPTAAAQTTRAGKKAPAAAQSSKGKNHSLPVAPVVNGGETIESIFARNHTGRGGFYALSKIKSHIMRGHVNHSLSPIPGTFEMYYKSPGQMLLVMNTPAGQFIQGFDGQKSWIQTPLASASLLGKQPAGMFDPATRHGRSRQPGAVYKVRGKTKVGEREADIVEVVVPGETTSTEYYDTVDGLLLRVDTTYKTPDSAEKIKVDTYFDRYAEVNGVKVPIKVRYVFQEATMTVNIYEVKHNVAINDALFSSPTQASKK